MSRLTDDIAIYERIVDRKWEQIDLQYRLNGWCAVIHEIDVYYYELQLLKLYMKVK